ncbi:MAG: hypothetical protein WCJ87_14290 [Burkholderiales bacterium]
MSTRHRAYTILCSLCCTIFLSAGGQAAAASAVPPPPDLSKLPAVPSAATSAPQDAARSAPSPEPHVQAGDSNEPFVQETVIEDDGARIDELKVRGRSKRIAVKPKVGPAYEIIPPGIGPDISQGARGNNGAVGKRVWPVLSF